MYRVFNMGIGFVIIVPKTELPRIKTIFRNIRQPWHQIGVIRKGTGVVTYKEEEAKK
jgi:phosphoribosylaminoimidazole (AIR) synthetase